MLSGPLRIVLAGLWLACACETKKEPDWEAGRRTLETAFQELLRDEQEGLGKFTLDEPLQQRLAGCLTDRMLPFIKAANCTAGSEAKVTQCLEKAGYQSQFEGHAVRCMAELLPDDWGMYRKLARQGFASKHTPDLGPGWLDCFVDAYIDVLNESGCKPVNRTATLRKEVLVPVTKCFENKKLTYDLFNRELDCNGKHPGPLKAAQAPGAPPDP